VQYRCQPGSKPGASQWTQESCNGGTCQGAACTGAPPPPPPNPPPNPPPGPEGCDNGVPVGGTACAGQGEDVQYRCLPGSKPGQSKWLPEACGVGRRCLGSACQQQAPQATCDGKPPGTRECKQPAGERYRICVQGPGGAAWADSYCPMGQTCNSGQCVATNFDTCSGAPLGSHKCNVEGGTERFECARPNGFAMWLSVRCAPGEECRAGQCVLKSASCDGKPLGARKCDFEGDTRVFECVQAAGFVTWAVYACGADQDCRGGQCQARVPRCGDDPIGARKCEATGGFRAMECRLEGNTPKWSYTYCAPGSECQQGQCVARQTTCEGSPIGARRCVVEGGTPTQTCVRPYENTPPQWITGQCGPDQACAQGTCVLQNHPQGAPHGRWPGKQGKPPRPQGRPAAPG
jgi:hypothetical protein